MMPDIKFGSEEYIFRDGEPIVLYDDDPATIADKWYDKGYYSKAVEEYKSALSRKLDFRDAVDLTIQFPLIGLFGFCAMKCFFKDPFADYKEYANVKLAMTYYRMGRFEEAKKCCLSALKLGQHAYTFYVLGWIDRAIGQIEDSEINFSRAIDLNPDLL